MIDLGIIEGYVRLPLRQVKLKWRADPKAAPAPSRCWSG
jgi:hypothetical protein